jgi:hypothetical protein
MGRILPIEGEEYGVVDTHNIGRVFGYRPIGHFSFEYEVS